MESEGYKVSSEIFEENNYITSKAPTFNKNNVVSEFNFTRPQPGLTVDADGDLDVVRRNSKKSTVSIEIEHSKSTVLGMVGLQVWRGALLMADWLINNHTIIPENSYILELGSGVGFTSIVASMFSPVICTDIDRGDILNLIKSNVARNKHLVRHSVEVLELDFMNESLQDYIQKYLPNISVIIAADTVYDDDITEAFLRTVQRLLSISSTKRTVYIALEKRFVFTIAECDTVAPCYEYFLECLQKLPNIQYEEVPLTFPKYFEYERVRELALWKVTTS